MFFSKLAAGGSRGNQIGEPKSGEATKASAENSPRVVFQFQWKKFPETVQAIHSLFAEDIELMHEGHSASHRAVFNHLGGKEFLVRRMLHEDEPVETKLPTVRAPATHHPL